MNLKMMFGGAAVAAASAALMSATPASATANYEFLDGLNSFFDFASSPITTQSTITPTFCSSAAICSTVTFTPGSSFDEVTLANKKSYYFAPTAFTTSGYYTASGPSADFGGQFATEISAAPEPASWALMIAGVGLAGGMLRYGRRQGALSVA